MASSTSSAASTHYSVLSSMFSISSAGRSRGDASSFASAASAPSFASAASFASALSWPLAYRAENMQDLLQDFTRVYHYDKLQHCWDRHVDPNPEQRGSPLDLQTEGAPHVTGYQKESPMWKGDQGAREFAAWLDWVALHPNSQWIDGRYHTEGDVLFCFNPTVRDFNNPRVMGTMLVFSPPRSEPRAEILRSMLVNKDKQKQYYHIGTDGRTAQEPHYIPPEGAGRLTFKAAYPASEANLQQLLSEHTHVR